MFADGAADPAAEGAAEGAADGAPEGSSFVLSLRDEPQRAGGGRASGRGSTANAFRTAKLTFWRSSMKAKTSASKKASKMLLWQKGKTMRM